MSLVVLYEDKAGSLASLPNKNDEALPKIAMITAGPEPALLSLLEAWSSQYVTHH